MFGGMYMKCPYCGVEVPADSKKCLSCGAQFVEQNTSQNTSNDRNIYSDNQSNSRIPAILQYGSIIISFIVVCIVLYAKKEGLIDIISTSIYIFSIFLFVMFFWSIAEIIVKLENINFYISKYKNKN